MFGRATLTLASFVLSLTALCAVEVLLRWAQPAALLKSRVYREHIYSEVYGWIPRPQSQGQWPNGAFFSINAAGYRGKALGERRSGVRRVVVLGDSIAFGAGVSDSETFAGRMQTAGSGFEVANLAVIGYGTDQEMLRLEREGFGLEPDVVILSFCLSNDYVDNMLEATLQGGGAPKPRFLVSQGELELRSGHLDLSWTSLVGLRLQESSLLFNALRLLVDPAHRADGPAPFLREHEPGRQDPMLPDFDAAADLTRRLILRTARLCRERGVDFLVVLQPDRAAYRGDNRRVAPLVPARDGMAGLRVIDLRQRGWAAGLAYEQIAFDDEGHLTAAGHAFVAQILLEELKKPG